ncbi:MAG: hypothetical protein QG641_2241 [Candidatus Poribacteria bacterium]|nr:hypothetical protein [Candidatus Poribacteria bacterium]
MKTLSICFLALAIAFVFSAVSYGKIIELFEDNTKFIDKLTNQDTATDIKNDTSEKYRGTISLRLESVAGVNNGQRYNPVIPDWSFKITKTPSADDEGRWFMFAWKKVGGKGIMIQFSPNGAWGAQPNGGRYYDGNNDAAWAGIQLSENMPVDWEVQIRDLYTDFKEFTLTGIALTQYNNVGYYDSIYLAWTEKELKDMLTKWNPVESLDKLPTVWGEIKSK